LALLAPSAAAEALAAYLGPENTTDRVVIRDALARALRSAPAPLLRELVTQAKGTPKLSDLLRAVSQRIPEIADLAYPLLAEVYRPGAPLEVTSFDERYLYVEPLAILAKSGHLEAKALLGRVAKEEKEEAIRARVLERVRDVPGFEETMTGALADKNPRVRALAAQGITRDGARPALLHLLDDPWTFVRTDAMRALERLPAEEKTDDALDKAVTNDPSAEVRLLAARALGTHRAIGHRETLRDVMDETKEEWSVRGAAAWALGAMCSRKDLDRLTDYAKASVVPGSNQGDIELGIAATEALGKLHPADIRERLSPVLGSKIRGPIRRAAESAVEGQGSCGK
jgi:tetratricopeptide (TPR) repeat protein